MGSSRRRTSSKAALVARLAGVAGFLGLALAPSPAASAPPPAGSTSAASSSHASAAAAAPSAATLPKPATKSLAPPAPASKPASRPAAAPAAKNATASAVRSGARAQDAHIRRHVAGGPTFDETSVGADTPELRALYAAERELFAPASPLLDASWPRDLPFPVAATEDRPRVHASGLSPAPPASAPPHVDGPKDMSWLAKLDMPDLPVRWDARVVKYLEFFKDDPRGRSTLTTWFRRSGRYREMIRRVLRRKGLPEDLTWLAMIESGFEPIARSHAGAMGLWQFMPETGKIYGLSVDRWVDQRLSSVAATEAAADFLADMYRRFGSWELAMAGYNMGYGGVLSAVRRYNTNDYWSLSKLEGSFPWETTLYVPKIVAAAIVARNLPAFGFQDVSADAPLEGEDVPVGPGIALATVAHACGVTTKELEQLNAELRASRTPPGHEDWPVKLPIGKAAACTQNLAKAKRELPGTERYVVRFGETLEKIAQARHVAVAKLVELNGLTPGEIVRGGMTLLVPKGDAPAAATDKPPAPPSSAARDPRRLEPGDKPVVVMPQDVFLYPDRRRVFYRVQVGDTVRELCATFGVSPDELRRWNDIDPSARLVDGMTLQLFAPAEVDLSRAVVLGEDDVRIVVAGTDEFFRHWDDKGRTRLVVTVKRGDTLESIGRQYGVTTNLMERINRRGRSEALSPGDRVVVWVARRVAPASTNPGAQASLTRPGVSPSPDVSPTPPLGPPPAPELLPPLP